MTRWMARGSATRRASGAGGRTASRSPACSNSSARAPPPGRLARASRPASGRLRRLRAPIAWLSRSSLRRRPARRPRSWNTDGSSPSRIAARITEPTGWMVSSTEVTAAGRRGRETEINSQPTTCELSASRISQPVASQPGVRSSSPRSAPAGMQTSAQTAVASSRGPAGRRRSRPASRSRRMKPEYAIAVRTPKRTPRAGSRPNAAPITPEIRTIPVSTTGTAAISRRSGFSPRTIQATNPTSTICRFPSTVASPAPTSAMEWCQKIRSAANRTPAHAARRLSRAVRGPKRRRSSTR